MLKKWMLILVLRNLHILMARFDAIYLLSLEWITGKMVKLENVLSLN